jgi:transposase
MISIEEEIERKIRFLEMAKEIENIAEASRIMGYSITTYYNLKKIYDIKGKEGLYQHIRRRSRLIEKAEGEVLEFAALFPKYGSSRISKELKLKGIKVSSGTVHAILSKHHLNTAKQRIDRFKK